MEIAVRNKLLEYTPLTNLISTRLYPLKLPQTPTYPAIVYQLISDPRREMGTKSPRYQYSIYGTTYGQVKDVESKLKEALETLEGTAKIFAQFEEDTRPTYENDTNLYSIQVDAIFYYQDIEEWG
jgi:hypothetical protein